MEEKRLLELKEWESKEVELTPVELAELQRLVVAKLTITPAAEAQHYLLKPASVVGSATTPHLQVNIEPKVGIDRVFFLLGYARRIPLLRESVDLGERAELAEAFVMSFLAVLQRALRRGLLMGYLGREEALPLVRGRVRFADQVRRRYGLPLPVEISYDDYTVDTQENRLLKAALRRLSYVRFRRPNLRGRINEALAALSMVSDVAYAPSKLPTFTPTRLTERYRAPLELARLILRNASIELEAGRTPTTGILFDMNDVFEDFLFAAVGDELRHLLPPNLKWRQGKSVVLDQGGHLLPEPDLSLWKGARCIFVGDVKYKTTVRGEVDDLYQMLAYCSATGCKEGLLVYAEAADPSAHQIVRGGPELHVDSLDATLPHDALMLRCSEIAERVALISGNADAA